jgi:hypothetical protein
MHFENATIHNAQLVREHLADFEFKKVYFPPYSPDLAPCNFFPIEAIKEDFSEQRFGSFDELSFALETLLDEASVDILQPVFQEWVRRLQPCWENEPVCTE